ncbi:MAG: class A beta-lactamase-related serine hydrolase, partial [Bacteroidetes bacterium]
MKKTGSVVGLFLVLTMAGPSARGQLCAELQREILEIIVNETDIRPEDTPGYALGLVVGDSTCFFGFGSARKDSTLPLRPDHVFEIGGLTTLFSAALLRVLETEGAMPLDSPLNAFLPPQWRNPETGALPLRRFLMHTTGLPRLPEGIGKTQRSDNDPFADYPAERLGTWFAHWKPPETDPGYSYSHINYALLELAVEHATGRPFEDLMEEKLLRPLGLQDTGFDLRPEQAARLLPGYDKAAQPTPPWHYRSFQGALGLKSTAADLLRFLQILMGVRPHPLTPLL